MYAVFRTGGKQYRASEGDRLRIEKLDVDEGADVSFDEVLLVGEGADIKVGKPDWLPVRRSTAKVCSPGQEPQGAGGQVPPSTELPCVRARIGSSLPRSRLPRSVPVPRRRLPRKRMSAAKKRRHAKKATAKKVAKKAKPPKRLQRRRQPKKVAKKKVAKKTAAKDSE